jgi:hypothetical protein
LFVIVSVGRAQTAFFYLLKTFLDTVSTSRTRNSFSRSFGTVESLRADLSIVLAYNSRSSRVSSLVANESRSAGWAVVSLHSGISSRAAEFTLVNCTKSSTVGRINELSSWAQNLYFSSPRTGVFVTTRYRSFRSTRAVIINRTIYFLEASFLVTVVATSASLLHHSFRWAEIARSTLYRSRRTQWAVVAINARNTVLLFKSLNLVKVSTRRTRLGLNRTSNTEVTFRTFRASHICSSHLITEISSSTLLALMFVNTLQKRIECSLGALEHERVVKLLITSRWAPMSDRAGISSSVTVLADHTRLATSAIG